MRQRRLSLRSTRAAQRGVVMYVAIVVLIVMLLAGIAMVRQVGGASLVAGNLAFRENATAVADLGTEAAIKWVSDKSASPLTAPDLNSDDATHGYSSSWSTSVDPSTFHFIDYTGGPDTGNKVQYAIHRLCQFAGQAPGASTQHCADSGAGHAFDKQGDPSIPPPPAPPSPLYRVTTRVEGPRNTVSFTQVIFY